MDRTRESERRRKRCRERSVARSLVLARVLFSRTLEARAVYLGDIRKRKPDYEERANPSRCSDVARPLSLPSARVPRRHHVLVHSLRYLHGVRDVWRHRPFRVHSLVWVCVSSETAPLSSREEEGSRAVFSTRSLRRRSRLAPFGDFDVSRFVLFLCSRPQAARAVCDFRDELALHDDRVRRQNRSRREAKRRVFFSLSLLIFFV